ncbi:permease-like cell division protein FtsX [Helcococcus bovis]|uniref:permease-like cell division protein FtsX n=1 Tax=Helcococcus bovis TaxID=3153252 RepID=UPI0038BC2DD4
MKVFRKFINTLKEGIKGIWKHKNLGLVSITSTFSTLFVIGIIIIITVSINNVAFQVQGKVNDVEIFIKKDATEVQIAELKHKIEGSPINKTVEFRSSKEALDIMKKSWGDNSKLLDNMDLEKVLPSSFIVKLEDISQAKEFAKSLDGDQSIEEINYYKDLVDKIYKVSNYVKIFGAVLVVVLMIVSLFIISNTIKLTVVSRINEIAIMKNVGATNNYIRIPFIIEGIFYSLIASILSFLAVYFLYKFIYVNFGARLESNFTILSLIDPKLLKISLFQIINSLGFGIGVIGSIFSIRRYLINREVKYVK